MEINLLEALEKKQVKEALETHKVLLSLDKEPYNKLNKLLKENGITFNYFVNRLFVLFHEGKVKFEGTSLEEILNKCKSEN